MFVHDSKLNCLLNLDCFERDNQPSTPGDNSELEPPLPIPNRTVKRLYADDSADYPCESR